MSSHTATEKLAAGLLKVHEPGLKKLQKQLAELTAKQKVILDEVLNENGKYQEVDLDETAALFTVIKEHHMKLVGLKREMNSLSERSVKLKKRALKLRDAKEREVVEAAQKRQSLLRAEEELIASPDPSHNPL